MTISTKTTLSTKGEKFLINDRLTYSEIPGNDPAVHGLLMNARFIQGIFDDKTGRARYARFGRERFDPSVHTSELARALPEWYRYGLRAFTVGVQGGMPVFTIENRTIDNNPYSEDGKRIDEAYLRRLESLIAAADEIGMNAIVSLLYQGQSPRMKDGTVIRNAVATACRFLRELGRQNIIIEVANEQNVGEFRHHPIVFEPKEVASLVELARSESGGIAVGCSSGGGDIFREIAEASDILLIHGNGCTRQQYHNLIRKTRGLRLGRPIVCNEDSPCFSQLTVAFHTQTSWGYYNNLTKQEPPADWGVTRGEDLFFARRMALALGVEIPDLPAQDQYYLQGLEPHVTCEGKRWIRVSSEYPESIDFVEFFHDGSLIDVAYDEPFFLFYVTDWIQDPIDMLANGRGVWTARIHLRSGEIIERQNEIA